MAEVDHEVVALRAETNALKEEIVKAQEAAKDKKVGEICSDLSSVTKPKLQTKRILRGHIHKVNAIQFAQDNR
jgi:hypothetical protein